MTRFKRAASRSFAFAKRHQLAIAASGAATVGGLIQAGSAFATGAVYSIGGVVTSTQSNIAADIPVVLAILGALIALAWAIRFLTKHIGGAKG